MKNYIRGQRKSRANNCVLGPKRQEIFIHANKNLSVRTTLYIEFI